MALLVCRIFAVWASIEHDIGTLLHRILQGKSEPALAIYSILQTQSLQSKALEAAAKAALPDDDYEIFLAVMAVTDSVRTPRNHLAHWSWAKCAERPDLLALADPDMVKDRDLRLIQEYGRDPLVRFKRPELSKLNPDQVLCYSSADLERALQALEECDEIISWLEMLISPVEVNAFFSAAITPHDPALLRAELLRRLNDKRLFREALDRIQKDRQRRQR
jgi:hypothetical protein